MIDLRKFINYLPSQENIGCCTSSASLLAAEIILSQAGNRPVYFSRLFVYYMARKLQGRLGQKGTELKATLEAMQQYGVCKDITWPLRHSIVDKEPNMVAIREAEDFKVNEFEDVGLLEFNSLLDNGIPIIIGMRTGRQFWKLSGDLNSQRYKPVNDTDNWPSNGHAMTIIGYDNNLGNGSWIIANSLGLHWGHKGYGALPYECAADIGEAYIIRRFAGNTVGKNFQRFDK
jgi:C1A family cysteine protease